MKIHSTQEKIIFFNPKTAPCSVFFFFFFSHRTLSFGDNYFSSQCQSFGRLQLPSPTVGPEALAFDYLGAGPYASVADGRVLKWLDASSGFVDFTVTSLNR